MREGTLVTWSLILQILHFLDAVASLAPTPISQYPTCRFSLSLTFTGVWGMLCFFERYGQEHQSVWGGVLPPLVNHKILF